MAAEPPVSFVIEALVSPSEDCTKVLEALRAIVPRPAGDFKSAVKSVSLESSELSDLVHLKEQLRDRQVRSAARRFMVVAREGKETTLLFNRQAAAAGVVALCGEPRESPLGPLVLRLESEQLDSLLDWLAGYPQG